MKTVTQFPSAYWGWSQGVCRLAALQVARMFAVLGRPVISHPASSAHVTYPSGGKLIELHHRLSFINHPITFLHDNKALFTLDMGPWQTFHSAAHRISGELGVEESSVELRFNGKKLGLHEKPFNVGIKPWAATAALIVVRIIPKPLRLWQRSRPWYAQARLPHPQIESSRPKKPVWESESDSDDFTKAAQNKRLPKDHFPEATQPNI